LLEGKSLSRLKP